MCNYCSGWVNSNCSGLQNAAEYRRIKIWVCSSCSSPPTPPIPQPLPSPTKDSDGDPFTILQFNANGIGNKQVELYEFLERHKVKVAHLKFSDAKHPEVQHSRKILSSRPMRWFTHIDSQINKLLSEARITRGKSSFGRVDYYRQAGKHRVNHYQRLHTPSKLLYRRIQSISGSSDDDDGHPHTGRRQCSPLIVVFKFYRFERHYVGEHGVWLKLRYSQLGFTNKIAGQCQPRFP